MADLHGFGLPDIHPLRLLYVNMNAIINQMLGGSFYIRTHLQLTAAAGASANTSWTSDLPLRPLPAGSGTPVLPDGISVACMHFLHLHV
jgi:hypothetical protein